LRAEGRRGGTCIVRRKHGAMRFLCAQTEARCSTVCCRGTMMSFLLCGGGRGADQGRVKTARPEANRCTEVLVPGLEEARA